MKEKALYFGDFIKDKRKSNTNEPTITQIADYIGVSKAFYCDVENKRRAPFDGKRLEMLAAYLDFSQEDTELMFDLASHYKGNIPYDIEDALLNKEVGELAQTALRLSKGCDSPEAAWKRLIRQLEKQKTDAAQGGDIQC